MHTLFAILGGCVLLGVFALLGKLWGGHVSGIVVAAKVFVPVWLVVSLVNIWVGVTKAGYGVAQELPILFLVFGVPASVAIITSWQLAKA